MNLDEQTFFNFDAEEESPGFVNWEEQRRQATRRMAQRLGLPLGRKVELWLRGEIRLIGVLRIKEEQLFDLGKTDQPAELIIDGISFKVGEIASCVAIDA